MLIVDTGSVPGLAVSHVDHGGVVGVEDDGVELKVVARDGQVVDDKVTVKVSTESGGRKQSQLTCCRNRDQPGASY